MSDLTWTADSATLGELVPWERNPKSISKRNAERLLDYWRRIGQFQSVAIGPGGEVYDGHQRLSVLKAAFGPSYRIDVRRASRALSEAERQELVIAAHAGTTGQWDWDALASWDTGELKEWGFDTELLHEWNADAENLREFMTAEAIEQSDAEEPVIPPDAVWPTDNDWGVPLLDINLQARALDLPFVPWGTGNYPRKSKMPGTWHFYTEDYRFENLWADPAPVVLSRCINAVEPNFSCYDQMPPAVALWQIYRKRWIARWWQSFGIRVFADLNVAEPHYALNLLGVPKGWTAWATRGYTERMVLTDREYEMACEHAGTTSILFVVYGGGVQVKEMCQSRGWLWFDEERNLKEGRHG